jgi:uncharacterized delta-60 repeat protein
MALTSALECTAIPAWLRTVSEAALLVALPAGRALAAAPGDLDPTFGGGRVIVPFGSEAGAGGVAVQPDGKVVVAGSSEARHAFAVARLLPNGSPDPSFGEAGVVTTPLGEFASSTDVAVQSDGKIVAVGEANEDFAIVRYLKIGELDPNFGEGGVVIMPVGTLGDSAEAVAIGPGGLIAVTGTSDVPPSANGAGVAVLKGNGDPETNFAEGGTTVVTTESGEDDRGEGIAFQGDGRILIADATGAGAGDGFTIVRLGTDGKPDASFGGDGSWRRRFPAKEKSPGDVRPTSRSSPTGRSSPAATGSTTQVFRRNTRPRSRWLDTRPKVNWIPHLEPGGSSARGWEPARPTAVRPPSQRTVA